MRLMSFSIALMIAVCTMSALVPIIGLIAFRKGYELGVKDFNSAHDDIQKNVPVEGKQKLPAPDPELQRLHQILENIENYDGTSANQKEIN